jgi:hypothetical protein
MCMTSVVSSVLRKFRMTSLVSYYFNLEPRTSNLIPCTQNQINNHMKILSKSPRIVVFTMVIAIGCKAVSYFNTPNDVFKKEGVVYLLNGTERKGEISVMFETGHDVDKFIHLENAGREERVLIDSIKSYRINEDYYFPKKIALDNSDAERLLFVKRLTKENSRINLYELYQARRQTSDGQKHFFYYISLPAQSRLEVWNIASKNLVPNFDNKMGKLVEDCPVLSNKIKSRNSGYFLAQYTLSDLKKVDVLKRIIDEYNDCH